MRPFAVLIAIIFGSSAAISFGLVATLFVLFVLRNDYPEYAGELPALARSSMVFLVLLAASGASLYGLLRSTRWRWVAVTTMCLIILGLILLYWPQPRG